jgi:hypothetical protein
VVSERYDWDGMQIGETRAFQWVYRSAVATSFASYAKVRRLDWECTSRSDPPTPERGKPCNTVWITRIEPRKQPSGVLIPEPDNPAVPFQMIPRQPEPPMPIIPELPEPFKPIKGKQRWRDMWVLDLKEIPKAERQAIYEFRSGKVRAGSIGWYLMRLDEWKIVRTERSELRSQIILACIPRGLLWRFHMIRCAPPKAERSGQHADAVWHCVRRVL